MPDILPTHHCFDDALDYIVRRLKQHDPTARDLILVHATCLGSTGTLYAHAWVEDDDLVWDAGILQGVHIYYAAHRDEYYREKKVQQTSRYTVEQAYLLNMASNTFGPWEPVYQALCSGDKSVLGKIEADASQAKVERL